MKKSEIRKRLGLYAPTVRTKPTVRQLGRREPGPHGKTLERRPRGEAS